MDGLHQHLKQDEIADAIIYEEEAIFDDAERFMAAIAESETLESIMFNEHGFPVVCWKDAYEIALATQSDEIDRLVTQAATRAVMSRDKRED